MPVVPASPNHADLARQRPVFGQPAFVCPHCQAYAQQFWFKIGAMESDPPRYDVRWRSSNVHIDAVASAVGGLVQGDLVQDLRLTRCGACDRFAVWVGQFVGAPRTGLDVPVPVADMPEDVRADFQEASTIFRSSPRAAAAILRLALEKLCQSLGKSGPINTMIADLVKDGLDPRLQKAFDYVRVIGNEAVHPGEIHVGDSPEIVATLFKLLNIIVERMITEAREISELYASLPETKREGIEKRDNPKA